MRWACSSIGCVIGFALATSVCLGQGGLRDVGEGPSVNWAASLPSHQINRTLGTGGITWTTSRDLLRATPPQQASYLAARGIVTSLARGGWRPPTLRDLAPGVKPTGLSIVRSIATLDFEKRGRFATLKQTALALAERARGQDELSLEQVSFGFRQFMYPAPLVDRPDAGYGFFSRADLVGGGTVDPSIFLDPFTEDVQKSLGQENFLKLMEALLGDRPPAEGPDFANLYDTQLAALGNYLFNTGRYRWAAEAWGALAKRDATNATAARAHGLALLAQGRTREAAAELRRSFQVAKGWPDTIKIVGSNLQDVFPTAEQLVEVRDELKTLLEKTPKDADLGFLMAFLDLFQGRWDEARERLTALADADAVSKGLLAALERGAVDEMVKHPIAKDFRRAADQLTGLEEPALTPEERQHLIQALREGPESYEDYMRLGDFRFYMGEFTQAGEVYRQAHKQRLEDPFALFAMVHAAFANGEFRLASRYLEQALAIEPDWALFEFRLQEFYGSVDEYLRHLANLERQAELRPDAAEAKFLLAYVYYFSGRFADSADLMAQVLRLEPGFKRADYFLRLARLQG